MNRKIKNKKGMFGQRVKQYRESLSPPMTQEVLAKAASIRVPYLSDLERGVRADPRLSTVIKVCNAFGITFDELIIDKK